MSGGPRSSEGFVADLIGAALMYAGGGLPVFPVHSPRKVGMCDCRDAENCTSPAKHPRTANGFKDATADELTIRRWWKEAPRANVAIAVPPGYVVLDVDGQAGLDAIAEANYEIPTTPTAATGKGWHYWFRTEKDLPPRANMLPKVDLRGPGSYVVAPPSLHVTGRQYTWQIPPTGDFALVPAWLDELARKSSTAVGPNGEHVPIDMSTILAGVPAGRRDVELFRAASKLRYADVPYEWAIAAVEHAAANCQPPMDLATAKAKVDSAYGRYKPTISLESGQGEASLLSDDSVRVQLSGPNGPVEFVFSDMEKVGPSLDAELAVQLLMPGTTEDRYIQHINLMSHSARDSCRRELQEIFGLDKSAWAKLINRAVSQAQQLFLGVDRAKRICDIAAPSQIEYIIDEIVAEERPTILFGAGSAGKTFITMSMMLAICRGQPWMGRPTQKRNCMLVDYETGETTAAYRLGRLAAALGLDGIPENLHIWYAGGTPFSDQVDAIKRSCEARNIGFIALDHVGAACGSEPEKAESALRFYRNTTRLKLPVLALAHVTGNAETDPDLVKRPFGSIFWNNGAGLTWYVRREEQREESDVIELGMFSRKHNDSSKPRDFGLEVSFDGRGGPIDVHAKDLRDSLELTGSRGKEHILYAALEEGPMTVGELAKATRFNASTIKSVLQRHADMFQSSDHGEGGRGKVQTWQRLGALP